MATSDDIRVYSAREHETLSIPPELIFSGGRLLLNSAIEKKGYLAISLKDGAVKLRATSWIGYIPLNEHVAIEIEPRIKIGVMRELLTHVPAHRQNIIPFGHFRYNEGDLKPKTLTDVLAHRLIALVGIARRNGLDAVYKPIISTGSSPLGGLMPMPTKLRQAVMHDPTQSVSRSWIRSVDTAPNRMLLAALRHLIGLYRARSSARDARALFSSLAQAATVFDRVHLHDGFIHGHAYAPLSKRVMNRPEYVEAAALAKAVFTESGIDPKGAGPMMLSPVVVNLEEAFEGFLRSRLSDELVRYRLSVFDGNREPAAGRRKPLYTLPKLSSAKDIVTQPDIVIEHEGKPLAVIDVKYKPYSGNAPDRSDVEQVMTYAAVYNVKKVLIAVPERPTGASMVIPIGQVGDVEVAVLAVDLDTNKLDEEISALAAALSNHLLASGAPRSAAQEEDAAVNQSLAEQLAAALG